MWKTPIRQLCSPARTENRMVKHKRQIKETRRYRGKEKSIAVLPDKGP
jgi:hypothetical protein